MLARTAKRRLLALALKAKVLHRKRGREGTDRANLQLGGGALESIGLTRASDRGSTQQLAPESRPILAVNQLSAADDCWQVREVNNPKFELVLGLVAREAPARRLGASESHRVFDGV